MSFGANASLGDPFGADERCGNGRGCLASEALNVVGGAAPGCGDLVEGCTAAQFVGRHRFTALEVAEAGLSAHGGAEQDYVERPGRAGLKDGLDAAGADGGRVHGRASTSRRTVQPPMQRLKPLARNPGMMRFGR